MRLLPRLSAPVFSSKQQASLSSIFLASSLCSSAEIQHNSTPSPPSALEIFSILSTTSGGKTSLIFSDGGYKRHVFYRAKSIKDYYLSNKLSKKILVWVFAGQSHKLIYCCQRRLCISLLSFSYRKYNQKPFFSVYLKMPLIKHVVYSQILL